jgi:hypothetical protein
LVRGLSHASSIGVANTAVEAKCGAVSEVSVAINASVGLRIVAGGSISVISAVGAVSAVSAVVAVSVVRLIGVVGLARAVVAVSVI